MTQEGLFNTLDDLGEEEFKNFKWFLQQRDILGDYQTIKRSELENAERLDTLNVMLSTFELHGALTVTKKVLKEMNRNDLVESLPDASSGPEDIQEDGTKITVTIQNVYIWRSKRPDRRYRVDHSGEQWLRPGLRKYACELTLDTNTVNRHLKLSDNNQKVTRVRDDQLYPDHPERFDLWYQLMCTNSLTGRCYWEVEWEEYACIAVTYRGIKSRGGSRASCFGQNNQSWSLFCSEAEGFSVSHNNIITHVASSSSSSSSSTVSNRVGVYVDWPAGTLSFYRVSSDTLIHLHTFSTTFTEPLYPGFGFVFVFGFGFGLPGSSVSLCSL